MIRRFLKTKGLRLCVLKIIDLAAQIKSPGGWPGLVIFSTDLMIAGWGGINATSMWLKEKELSNFGA
ncbi:MAG TPA: hypothetical protein VN612_03560 [Acidobacteriaceae bacterium]|nr:hypothetical protein [Acidobacteriaceae bacterium]